MKILLILSLAANLLLAGRWFTHQAARPTPAAAPAPRPTAAASPAPPVASRQPQYANTTWADLQTDDLRELIKHLRAAGCPEATVQDIVLADVNRRFAVRLRKVLPPGAENRPFWQVEETDPAARKQRNELWHRYNEQDKSLQQEKSTLLVKLLGVDPEQELRVAEGLPADPDAAEVAAQLEFLPEDKREAVAKFVREFETRRPAAGGVWDAAARAQSVNLEQEKVDGLAQILSPAELREYQLRLSPTARRVMSELRDVSLTRGQYEALFDITQKYGYDVMGYPDVMADPAKRRQLEDNRRSMQADIAFALGADKAFELRRANDYVYQQLQSYARHYQLPADAAAKIYGLKEAAETGAEKVSTDISLDPNQKLAALQQIRADTENSVKAALGKDAFQRYQKRNGGWLQNLAPDRRP